MSAPTVSVSMVTYNQEGWVGAALESALSQDLEDLEVVVGDDASTDATLDVVEAFAARDPRVRILDTPEKLGPRANYMRTLLACRGEFVSQLDGDDLFTDPCKLRLQVEALRADPTLAGVFCTATRIDDEGAEIDGPRAPRGRLERYGLAQFAYECGADSCTVLFRRPPDRVFPDWYRTIPVGDWPLHMLNMLGGDYAYMNRTMSAYRVHAGGVWNRLDADKRIWRTLECQRHLLEGLPAAVRPTIAPPIASRALSIARRFARAGRVGEARKALQWIDEHAPGAAPLGNALKTRLLIGWKSVFGGPGPDESDAKEAG